MAKTPCEFVSKFFSCFSPEKKNGKNLKYLNMTFSMGNDLILLFETMLRCNIGKKTKVKKSLILN